MQSLMSRVSRRDFIRMVACGTCGAAVHNMWSPGGVLAYAATSASMSAAYSGSPIFVLVNLAGGCSYNLAPIYHGAYRDKNPTISYGANNSLPIAANQGLHPALSGIHNIFVNEGKVALLNLVGYDPVNPNRSHDESTAIWHSGVVRTTASAFGGWAARLTCQIDSVFAGVSLGGSNVLTSGDCNPPRSFGDLSNFGESPLRGDNNGHAWLKIARDNIRAGNPPSPNEKHQYIRVAMDNWDRSVELLGSSIENIDLAAYNFGGGFESRCRDAATLIASGLPVRFIYLEIGGFDTHSDERQTLTNNLTAVNNGLSKLIQVAKDRNRWQDLVICTMSEFSRTHENQSQGTDHGHAAPMLIMGGRIAGGQKNPEPQPTQLGNEYIRAVEIDFRQVFRQVIEGMGYNGSLVFPEAAISNYPLNLFA